MNDYFRRYYLLGAYDVSNSGYKFDGFIACRTKNAIISNYYFDDIKYAKKLNENIKSISYLDDDITLDRIDRK